MHKGTVRIRARDLAVVEYTGKTWRKSTRKFPTALNAAKLYKARGSLGDITDKKDPRFIRGYYYKRPIGARITIHPNGNKLDKAFSIFAPHLTIHDEKSHDHWDVLYQNPGGTWSYVYTLAKRQKHVRKKYKLVDKFAKHYPKLRHNVVKALHDENDDLALPMYTLLKTCMRVGTETYYRAHGHAGLTTLTRRNIDVDGNVVTFRYLSKGGVPRQITERYPETYLVRLLNTIEPLKQNSFIFTNANGKPFSDRHFKQAFKKYCGQEFYPHIVRSFYATARVKQFLKGRRKASKEEVKDLFTSIAEKLGHRKFDKHTNEWKECYNVTMNYYVQPEILERVKKITY